MSRLILRAPSIKRPIQPAPGFTKKQLATHKVDLKGRCDYDCQFCSSPAGRAMNVRRSEYLVLATEQFGRDVDPATESGLSIEWPDVLQRLQEQLATAPSNYGRNRTVVVSMLTDPFSPRLIRDGTTRAALSELLDQTEFRIRVLTKGSIVGNDEWIDFFHRHRQRFIVGMSIGTLDDEWAMQVERFTAKPTRRIKALHALQDAGISTYGMLCPVFPHVLQDHRLERLIELHRPERLEHIWCEPFNDRRNWRKVRQALPVDAIDRQFLTEIFERRNHRLWSRYATQLYLRLRETLKSSGAANKLRYLLYEAMISQGDAAHFSNATDVLLQGKVDSQGFSSNEHIAAWQARSNRS